MFDRNIWNYLNVYKLFEAKIVYKLIIIIMIAYLKRYNCLQKDDYY